MFESIFKNTTKFSAFVCFMVLLGIGIVLFINALPAIKAFGLGFIIDTSWIPNKEIFGGGSAIVGTLLGTFIAMLLATPLALGAGIFLDQSCPKKIKQILGSCIELLAAIPSIIYGMLGLFYVVPIIGYFSGGIGLGVLSAGIVLSIMILPFMCAITRDCMAQTPDILKESAYALGATKWEVIKDVIIPYVKVGVIGGVILALGRALGETMAVTFVIGNSHKISSLVSPATNIPATLANEFAEADGILHQSSLFYLGLILFAISFLVIYLSKAILLKRIQNA
ncbi:phosphate ABC transporter permease subunit PstC [Helicobacter sp. 16-1353]|uniref:phosphate ABC transporter permease subunit PstC n=1 Tax=Helicobacter sp. 16-1353 TaxID=2004996 RepID=UPI000DCF2D34|nr:phosphate ABC transporter permease subunit PstC [Helicobacter sp. 16-1353]RAX53983.1 phosphate ABC transporter permease subunit PstC [Helicobacter sp. 16-1353]